MVPPVRKFLLGRFQIMKIGLIILLLTATGCFSVGSLYVGSKTTYPNSDSVRCGEYMVPRVYSGIAGHLAFLRGDHPDKGIVVLDIPFSFIVDTVVLPYTIFMQAKYGNLCDAWGAD